MIAIDLADGYDAARSVMAAVGLFTPAEPGVHRLPDSASGGLDAPHRGEEAQAEGRIGAGLLRLSVGLEDVDDLWADLSQAGVCSAHGRQVVTLRADTV